ncbi:MAG TPA: LLM class flavin-dependent oxidoreductase [Candidatus Pseudogracilibacillus intestinigallinarum]|uniref:LLM class flavin-dependent oxidoreductase n=1 Tax=Candidatus Pseudogracilibacillus intestinigallinarum TaxID=2838742 RepID=A0A9D1PLF7_9BACI|nr:LLM class flavin-dependent oxidoreductase [Candidatus Pseudogracilibacillus intestinigallinarum]
MRKHVPLSVLDLVGISKGQTVKEAIDTSMEHAQFIDELGFKRLWYAEHHNAISLAAVATPLLIGRAASLTKNIRVGSGGIMLPNHAHFRVAEEFGTLAQMYPNRIDLGLGRAPGTDGMTAQLITRTSGDAQEFANNIYDMIGWFSEDGVSSRIPNVTTGVATNTNVPIWVLGSSMNGAHIAGQLGLPYSIATHFMPDDYEEKLAFYRSSFDSTGPTATIDTPYSMAAINVVVAPTDEEAERIFTSTEKMFINLYSGERNYIEAPVDPTELPNRHLADSALKVKAVGSPETVRKQLEAFAEKSKVDELMIVTYAYHPEDRKRSMELLADVWF